MDFLATALKRLQVELKRTIEPAPNLPDRQQQLVEALEEAVSKTGKKCSFWWTDWTRFIGRSESS